MMNKNIKIN